MTKIFCIFFLRIYQCIISPFLLPKCRFDPTCSQYGINCIIRFGILKGIWLTFKQIIKCHSFF